ncbi:MAG TPA: hypothetical protein VJ917_07295 [Saprospiraceae bacterium]|nr:hypothetical protein [Saprospiraceae bacterium]
MNARKIIIAGLVGSVIAYLLGWLIWGNLLSDIMENYSGSATGVMRSDSEMLHAPLAIGHLGFGFLLAVIFGRWASISTFSTGLIAGGAIGFLSVFGSDLIMLGTTHLMQVEGVIIDIIAGTVSMGLTGGVVGWMLGR